MGQAIQTSNEGTIAILGGTGHVGMTYIEEFLSAGFRVRILARSPGRVRMRFSECDVAQGSMMEQGDVEHAMEGADAAFLITPIGGNNKPEPELSAARTAIAAAQATHLRHLIYASQILPARSTGVAILDAKAEIERMLEASQVPWSSLCIGCYMDEWLGMAPGLLKLGLLLNPVSASRQFSFTCKRDVARIAVKLLQRGHALNGTLDVIEPTPRTLTDAAELIGKVLGRKVTASGRWPLLPMMRIALPLFRVFKPVMASKVILVGYFDRHGYVGNTGQMAQVLPDLEMTTLEKYLRETFKADKNP